MPEPPNLNHDTQNIYWDWGSYIEPYIGTYIGLGIYIRYT